MKNTDVVYLEVRVDRANEKWVFIAEQIFNIFHDTLEENGRHFSSWFRKTYKAPSFSFEVANIGGVLRFFFVVDSEYADLLEHQIYAHYPQVEIMRTTEYLPDAPAYVASAKLDREHVYPIKIYTDFKERSEKETVDPLSSITSALSKSTDVGMVVYQVVCSAAHDSEWKSERILKAALAKHPKWIKKILASKWGIPAKIVAFPFMMIGRFFSLVIHGKGEEPVDVISKALEKGSVVEEKLRNFGYRASVRVASYANTEILAKSIFREVGASLNIFSRSGSNGITLGPISDSAKEAFLARSQAKAFFLNTAELAGLVHLPTIYVKTPGINWVMTKKFEPPANLPILTEYDDATPIGSTNFRGTKRDFGSLPNDRRRHVYVIGKTGMGKSTLLENMIYDDIMKGRGVAVIDPHGDLAETILASIPKNRTNDVILFDPGDYKFPIAFNMLEQVKPELRPIVASGLVSIFKKIFGESWGPRLEHILRNTIMTLLEVPDATLMSIPLMLTMASYRKKIISKIKDPMLTKFWTSEYEALEPKQMVEAAGPILNKVGQFLSSALMRNILGQPKNPFSLRWVMDNKKIFICNLSKGRIGEDSSALLGAMMVTKFQIEAMSRADIPESDRVDFYLYVDEFQNFATDSFATILSEARKYKLNLVMANQYIEQMTETVQGAVFGNVGTTISFQVGYHDATVLSEVMDEEIVTPNDLMNLRKYDIYTKLLVDGMPSPVFSATTFAPIKSKVGFIEQKRDVILKVSREKYSKPSDLVEKKILEFNMKVVEEEKSFLKAQGEYKERKKEEKRLEQEAKRAGITPAKPALSSSSDTAGAVATSEIREGHFAPSQLPAPKNSSTSGANTNTPKQNSSPSETNKNSPKRSPSQGGGWKPKWQGNRK